MSFVDPRKNLRSFGLQTGMDVADLGAGAGHYAIAASELVGEAGHVCAVEIQKNLVAKIKNEAQAAKLTNVDVVWSDLEKPGGSTLEDATVDAVILSNILFQVSQPQALLQEAWRILRVGGKLLAIDWSDSYGGLGPPEKMLTSQVSVEEAAEAVGFTFGRDIRPGAHHWGVIFHKQS